MPKPDTALRGARFEKLLPPLIKREIRQHVELNEQNLIQISDELMIAKILVKTNPITAVLRLRFLVGISTRLFLP